MKRDCQKKGHIERPRRSKTSRWDNISIMYNGGVRNYGREANHSLNESARVEKEQAENHRMSVAKTASGKKALYMTFLRNEGFHRFRNMYGKPYDKDNAGHQQKMTELYNAFRNPVDDYGRAKLERIENEIAKHNSNRAAVKETKQRINENRRRERHNNPEKFGRARSEHVQNLNGYNRNQTCIPSKIEEVITDEDTRRFRERNKNTTEQGLIAHFRACANDAGSPICRPDFNVHVISLFPIFYLYKPKRRRLSCYPAEISVSTFNLVDGIISNGSKFVRLDPVWAFGESEAEERREINDVLEQYGNIIGKHCIKDTDEETPYDVFNWLIRTLDRYPSGRIVVYRDQYRFVYNGLKLLSKYCGLNYQDYFSTKIANRLVSIEDFTNVIMKLAPRNESSPWRECYTDRYFGDMKLIPFTDKDLYCEVHEASEAPTKYNCMKVQNARLIHTFFHIMHCHKLQGFYFNQPCHNLCDATDDPSVPLPIKEPDLPTADGPCDSNNDEYGEENSPNYEDGGGDEHDDEEDEDYGLSGYMSANRSTQSPNDAVARRRSETQDDMHMQANRQLIAYSNFEHVHQENYFENQNHMNQDRQQHDNANHWHQRTPHNDEQYESRNDVSFRDRNETFQNNDRRTDHRAGEPQSAHSESRFLADSPNRDVHPNDERQVGNGNTAPKFATESLNPPKPYVEYPNDDNFDVPVPSSYSFNDQEILYYLKISKKSSKKEFKHIDVGSELNNIKLKSLP